MLFNALNLDLALDAPPYEDSTMIQPQEPSRMVQEDDITLFCVVYRDFNPLKVI